MHTSTLVIGGLALAGAGGYAIWYYWPKIEDKIHPPPKEKGWLEKVLGSVLGEDFISKMFESADATVGLPALMIHMFEAVAIVGIVLVSVLILVFAYRMFQGNTPDIAGSIATVAQSLPTAQVARAALGK